MNLDLLSKAQRVVFDRLVQGRERTEIAEELCRSLQTIHSHVATILMKLDIPSQTKLIVTYYQEKLCEATSGAAQLSAASHAAGEQGADVRFARSAARPQISAPARVPQGARAAALSDLPALMRRQAS